MLIAAFLLALPVREVHPPDAAVCVDLNPESLHVVGAVRPTGEVSKVKLDLEERIGEVKISA